MDRTIPGAAMTKDGNLTSFALRLPRSTRRQANEIAKNEGISLNQFITIALAERIVRLESGSPGREEDTSRRGPENTA
jgi:hypothetical protein